QPVYVSLQEKTLRGTPCHLSQATQHPTATSDPLIWRTKLLNLRYISLYNFTAFFTYNMDASINRIVCDPLTRGRPPGVSNLVICKSDDICSGTASVLVHFNNNESISL